MREVLEAIKRVPYEQRFLLDTDAALPTVRFYAGRTTMDGFASEVRGSGWWQIGELRRKRIMVVA